MILIYAFSNQWGTNISRRVFSELQKLLPPSDKVQYQTIFFHPKTFFNKYIKKFSPPLVKEGDGGRLIIGLGDFFGDLSKIRLETVAHNVYGDNPIEAFSPITLELSLPILDNVDTAKFNITEHMGSYNCNWIAYQIEKYIRDYSPNTRQLFFHLPKKATASTVAAEITELLQNNKLI